MTLLSSRRALCASALGSLLVLVPCRARADDSRLHLRYEAPRGCPSKAKVTDELRARVDPHWLEGADTRTFDVRISRHADGSFSGTLAIVQADRAPRLREIRAESCRAVATSIAVFIAIALDPASEQPAEPPRFAEEAPAEEGEPPMPRANTLVAPGKVPKPPRAPPRRAPMPRVSESSAVWIWSAGYGVNYVRMPAASWGNRLHAELMRTFARSLFAPALRVSWGWSDFSSFPPLAGEARFRLTTARVEACGHIEVSALAVAACAGADVGTLRANVPELAHSIESKTHWTAALGLLRAGWSILPWLALEIEGDVLLPIERTRFGLTSPARLVYRAPPVVFGANAGLGVMARFR